MKRKMMAIVTASLIMMTLWGASAYAEQEDYPTEPTTVEVIQKEEAETPTPTPEAETPVQDETPSETPAPVDETPVPEVETLDQVKAFEGSVSVSILGKGAIAYGDQVTLMATLTDTTDIMYSLRWEVNDGNGWQMVEDECNSTYTFTLTEQNAGYQWRVVAITEA